jgi:hypothetical protein
LNLWWHKIATKSRTIRRGVWNLPHKFHLYLICKKICLNPGCWEVERWFYLYFLYIFSKLNFKLFYSFYKLLSSLHSLRLINCSNNYPRNTKHTLATYILSSNFELDLIKKNWPDNFFIGCSDTQTETNTDIKIKWQPVRHFYSLQEMFGTNCKCRKIAPPIKVGHFDKIWENVALFLKF